MPKTAIKIDLTTNIDRIVEYINEESGTSFKQFVELINQRIIVDTASLEKEVKTQPLLEILLLNHPDQLLRIVEALVKRNEEKRDGKKWLEAFAVAAHDCDLDSIFTFDKEMLVKFETELEKIHDHQAKVEEASREQRSRPDILHILPVPDNQMSFLPREMKDTTDVDINLRPQHPDVDPSESKDQKIVPGSVALAKTRADALAKLHTELSECIRKHRATLSTQPTARFFPVHVRSVALGAPDDAPTIPPTQPTAPYFYFGSGALGNNPAPPPPTAYNNTNDIEPYDIPPSPRGIRYGAPAPAPITLSDANIDTKHTKQNADTSTTPPTETLGDKFKKLRFKLDLAKILHQHDAEFADQRGSRWWASPLGNILVGAVTLGLAFAINGIVTKGKHWLLFSSKTTSEQRVDEMHDSLGLPAEMRFDKGAKKK